MRWLDQCIAFDSITQDLAQSRSVKLAKNVPGLRQSAEAWQNIKLQAPNLRVSGVREEKQKKLKPEH